MGLVFILWEKPVVPRVASLSPVVLVNFFSSGFPNPAGYPDLTSQTLVRWSGGPEHGRKVD